MVEIKLKEQEQSVQRRAEEIGIGYINLKGFPIGQKSSHLSLKQSPLTSKL